MHVGLPIPALADIAHKFLKQTGVHSIQQDLDGLC